MREAIEPRRPRLRRRWTTAIRRRIRRC